MSTFEVTIREIESVIKHPNADKLDICRVKGLDYQFIYARDVLKPNDVVVYFPVDSLICSAVLIEQMGLTGKLSGKDKNRVKTIKLREAISQGVVIPYEKLFTSEKFEVGTNVVSRLGVEKYIPPERPCHCGNLIGLPDGISKYDIEGCDNYPDIVEELMDEKVCVTEKLEGTNFSITYTVATDEIRVNQHSGSIIEIPEENKENTFWKVARTENLIGISKKYCELNCSKTVTIFGELLGEGVEGNIYNLKGHTVRLYDVKQDFFWVDSLIKFIRLQAAGAVSEKQFVPILSQNKTLREWLDGKGIKEASHGPSALGDCIREGIVVTPIREKNHSSIGRLIIKQRDPVYLSKHDT